MSMLKSHSHTPTLSHSHSLTLSISHSLTLNMLNNFCFHVYAQKSLFKVENVNGFFYINAFFDKTLWTAAAPVLLTLPFIELAKNLVRLQIENMRELEVVRYLQCSY